MKTTLLSLSVLIFGLNAFSQGPPPPPPPPAPTQLCDMVPSRNNFEWIESVSIGEMMNTTGKSTTRSDEYEMSIGQNLEAGDQLPVLLTSGYKGRAYEEFWRIWIDLNNDNNYSEDEIVFEQKGKGSVSGIITIPEGGNGNSKVKVAMNWKYYPTCSSHANGEIEYYSADIKPTIVSTADFNLPVTIPIISVIDAPSTLDIQGTANNTDKKLTVNIPYTNGEGSYTAFTGEYVINNTETGKNGETNSFRITYPAGEFGGTGSIPVTIEIDGDESFDAKQVAIAAEEALASLDFKVNGQSKGNINLEILGGIPDRNFADADHKFIYLPVTAPDGSVWLNNKLGANYSNINNPAFNPLQTAISTNDYNAYGSLFQWGRYSDGHELMNHFGVNNSVPVNTSINEQATNNSPNHSNYINVYKWTNSDSQLWQGVNGVNNPCPVNYRIPTQAELVQLKSSETLTISFDGYRYVSGSYTPYHSEFLWSSEDHGNSAINVHMNHNDPYLIGKSYGLSIRCIKDQQED